MANHPKVVPLKNFKGLNNIERPERTSSSYLKKAENIDIDKTGSISKRKGYTLVNSGNYTSLWASERGTGCYAVKDKNLIQVLENYNTSILESNIGPLSLSFEEVDSKIFFTSPEYNGVIENGVKRGAGVPTNDLAPTLTEIPDGILNEGTYQVCFTYVYSNGLEGGTIASSKITVADKTGITLYIPTFPDDSNVLFARVYCSTQNGHEMYYHGIGTLGSTYKISDVRESINILRFFNLYPPPKGHIVSYYKGRLYIADENILWYSEPFQYEHFKMDSNYIEFPERIKEVMPVEDGIWIGCDQLYYLSGHKPEEFTKSTKEPINVIEGTSTKISGSYLHLDNTPIGYKWLVTSDLGIFVLFNQGLVINLTSENVAITSADKGTSVFLQDSGLNQYLSILKTNENPNNSVIGDFVETQIIRNGVIIN